MKKVANLFAFSVLSIALTGCGDAEPTGTSGTSSGGASAATSGPYSAAECKVQNPGTVNGVNCTLAALGNQSAIEPLTALVNSLTNGEKGALSPITGPLNDLTALNGGPIAPLTQLVQMLVAKDDAALAPVIVGLNSVLGGLMGGQSTTDISAQLQALFAGGLPTATSGSNTSNNSGLISAVTGLTGNLLGSTPLDPVNGLLVQIVDPNTGALSALTGPLNQVTSTTSGPLGPLTSLVNTLVNTDNQALEPVIAGLNALLGGLATGQSISTGPLAPITSALGV